jgi:hypothetical protein
MSKTKEGNEITLDELIRELFKNDADIDYDALPKILLSDTIIKGNTSNDDKVTVDATIIFDKKNKGEFRLVGKKSKTWQFVSYAGFHPKEPLDLACDIPLVGDKLKGNLMLKDAFLLITSKEPDEITIEIENSPTIAPGVFFGYDISLIGEEQQIILPVVKYKKPEPAGFASILTESDEDIKSSVYTLSIQKQIGPILIDSLSLSYSDQVITCSLSASMEVGPLSIALDGLSLGTTIKAFAPQYNIDGLGIGYVTPALTIEGAAIKIPAEDLGKDILWQFDGDLIIKGSKFGIAALVSYAQAKKGLPSLFAFANVSVPLGGPPFFMVTGLMAGFGFNRTLVMPAHNQVQDFPLLQIGNQPSGSEKEHAMKTLKILEGQEEGSDGEKVKWISPKTGDYWLAAGLTFSSFGVIEGSLLLIAEFGQDLQFAVLGMAWLSLPMGVGKKNSYIFIELQMEAVLKPTDGYFCAAASLTDNSFILTEDAHLTGDFSFNLWFGNNTNAGQFVITAGGYHPAFKPPSYYPEVQRLGFNWQITPETSITGNSYFAFTPSCGMAGNLMKLLYEHGSVKVWFITEGNFLTTWHPFSFVATLHIEVGVSKCINFLLCHKTASASVGATLDLWGPPLGGRVRVHITLITITIQFGSTAAIDKNKEVQHWKDFSKMLPDPNNICNIITTTGLGNVLLKDKVTNKIIYSNQSTLNPTSKIWVVRSFSFEFDTRSVIPSSSLTYGVDANHAKNVKGANIAIRPMNLSNVTSVQNVQISRNANGSSPIDIRNWRFTPNKENLAATLWGTPLMENGSFVQNPSKPSAETIKEQLTGYTVKAPDPVAGSTFGIVPLTALIEAYILPGIPQNPLNNKPPSSVYLPSKNSATLTNIGKIGTTLATKRNALYAALKSNNIYTGPNDSMNKMGVNVNNLFTAPPMEQP